MIAVGDVGTVWDITVKDGGAAVDISAASAMSLLFNPPGAAVVTKTPVFTSDGSDGQIKYVSQPSLFTVPGTWTLQGKIEFTGPTRAFYTDLHRFEVGGQLA